MRREGGDLFTSMENGWWTYLLKRGPLWRERGLTQGLLNKAEADDLVLHLSAAEREIVNG